MTEAIDHPKSAPENRATEGPLDESEANAVRPYVDLGGIKVLPRPDLRLRLEVEEGGQRVVAVALDYAQSTLQVQAFAAPRNSGLWGEIREQIADQVTKQGGTITSVAGTFGPELRAQLPETGAVRFVGVDGPRWFLRGVVSGAGATDPATMAELDDLFRSVVVVRGATPMPPRDLIPLHVPPSAQGDAPTQNA
ncbi:MAG TPA: DUF3710 domain-containing protein [Pseudolysinimonas sp.]|nr:DUF3710 domain-containing protein [Pseudolysinimonas sp.]